MQQQIITYVFPFASALIALLAHSYIIKKDKDANTIKTTTDMTILITKMDMLLTQNNGITDRINSHDKLIQEHSVSIAVLQDTQSFRRVKVND